MYMKRIRIMKDGGLKSQRAYGVTASSADPVRMGETWSWISVHLMHVAEIHRRMWINIINR
jgi:hypothetical protein